MELAEILRTLWSRKLVVCAILALAVGAAFGAGQLASSTPTGTATVQILVDSPQSALADLLQNTVPLTTRASLLAQVMASETVLEDVARESGVPVGELTAQGPYGGTGQALERRHAFGGARQSAAGREGPLPADVRGAAR